MLLRVGPREQRFVAGEQRAVPARRRDDDAVRRVLVVIEIRKLRAIQGDGGPDRNDPRAGRPKARF
ncbi:MAG TPA: hypothetical protein VFM14_16570 [Gemmatimonadales bacterium]|nr:hypothetical protein [Gemmatimonadales bacterium]